MAHDLRIQAADRQRRLQQERDQEVEFSQKVKHEVVEMREKEHRRTRSLANTNSDNQKELLK